MLQIRTLNLVLAALLATGCVSNDTRKRVEPPLPADQVIFTFPSSVPEATNLPSLSSLTDEDVAYIGIRSMFAQINSEAQQVEFAAAVSFNIRREALALKAAGYKEKEAVEKLTPMVKNLIAVLQTKNLPERVIRSKSSALVKMRDFDEKSYDESLSAYRVAWQDTEKDGSLSYTRFVLSQPLLQGSVAYSPVFPEWTTYPPSLSRVGFGPTITSVAIRATQQEMRETFYTVSKHQARGAFRFSGLVSELKIEPCRLQYQMIFCPITTTGTVYNEAAVVDLGWNSVKQCKTTFSLNAPSSSNCSSAEWNEYWKSKELPRQ